MVRAREEPVREDVARIFPTHIAIDAKKFTTQNGRRDGMDVYVCAGSVRPSFPSLITRVAGMYVQFP